MLAVAASMGLAIFGDAGGLPRGGLPASTPRVPTVVDSIEALVEQSDQLLGPSAKKRRSGKRRAKAPASPAGAAAASDAPAWQKLPACGGGVFASFTHGTIAPPAPNSSGYVSPEPDMLASFTASLSALLDGRSVLAAEYAALAGYELCAGEELEAGLLLWRPSLPGTGQALLAWRQSVARPLIVEAPHPFFDEGTLEQAWRVFSELGARALIVSGTHRCASLIPSGCDGFTSACDGTPARYRDSDMAHNNTSAFQLAHEILANHHAEDFVLSLHGMAAPGAVLSDGTLIPTSSTAMVARLTKELGRLFPDEPVRSCNAWPEVDGVEHLCGTTNTQGRYLNGIVEDHCLEPAVYSSGRFLHLEQSRQLRTAMDPLVQALDVVLPGASSLRFQAVAQHRLQ